MRADAISQFDINMQDLGEELARHGLAFKHLQRVPEGWIGGCVKLDDGRYITIGHKETIAELILGLIAAAALPPPVYAAAKVAAAVTKEVVRQRCADAVLDGLPMDLDLDLDLPE